MMMFCRSPSMFAVLLTIHCVLIVSAEISHDAGVSGWKDHIRQKRQILFAKQAKEGIEAVRRLTKGADQIFDSGVYRMFHKTGTYNRALQDFESVSPSSVSKFVFQGGNEGLVGNVGDRIILLEKKGVSGRPTIKIMQQRSHKSYDRIIYFDDGGKKWFSQ